MGKETVFFQSFITKEVYKMNHHFYCDSKCVIHLISCKVCVLQHVGSTVDRFHLRWNNYKYSERIASEGGTPKQNYFHQQFLSENHHGLLEDCEIIRLIDKTDPSDPTRREFFWMQKLNTLVPLGLNVMEVVSKNFLAIIVKRRVVSIVLPHVVVPDPSLLPLVISPCLVDL